MLHYYYAKAMKYASSLLVLMSIAAVAELLLENKSRVKVIFQIQLSVHPKPVTLDFSSCNTWVWQSLTLT